MTKTYLHRLFALAIVTVCLQSCDEGITLTLPVETPAVEITIPPIDTTGDFTVGPIPIPTNFDSIASANNIERSSITSVKVKSVTYTMVSPVDANFNLLESLSNHASTENLNEVRYAYIENIPDDGLNKLNLTTDDTELKDYVLNNEFLLTLKGRNDSPISNSLKVRMDMTLEMTARVSD